MNQPPVWVWDRILLAHMTLVLLQAENPESFGLNLPGSPSHAAEAVYAMPKPRICHRYSTMLQSFFGAWRGSCGEGEALGSCPADRGLH